MLVVRSAASFGLVMWVGAALVMSRLRWFSRQTLVDRLTPYVSPNPGRLRPPIPATAELSWRDAVIPFDRALNRLSRAVGIDDPLVRRLARIGSAVDVTGFRLRQLGWAICAFGAASSLSIIGGIGTLPSFILIITAPLVACGVTEHRLNLASAAYRRRVVLELPVIAEQLAMLVSAGYSIGSALNRLAERGQGHVAAGLRQVCGRVRQGLSEAAAITEWTELVDVPALNRLARVLVRSQQTPDLGRLLSAEAQAIRRDIQREVLADAERRAQAVWIPVTVAALVPGVVFLALPFIQALRGFTGP